MKVFNTPYRIHDFLYGFGLSISKNKTVFFSHHNSLYRFPALQRCVPYLWLLWLKHDIRRRFRARFFPIRVNFTKITSPAIKKDLSDLRSYDIRTVMAENSLKDMSAEDSRFVKTEIFE